MRKKKPSIQYATFVLIVLYVILIVHFIIYGDYISNVSVRSWRDLHVYMSEN